MYMNFSWRLLYLSLSGVYGVILWEGGVAPTLCTGTGVLQQNTHWCSLSDSYHFLVLDIFVSVLPIRRETHFIIFFKYFSALVIGGPLCVF